MPKKKAATRAPRKSSNGSPQLQICSVLLQNDLDRAGLAAELPGLSTAQISSALNNAKAKKRIKWKEADQVFTLTAAGKAWAEAATAEGEPAKKENTGYTAARARQAKAEADLAEIELRKLSGASAAHRRGRRVLQLPAVDTSPATGGTPLTFRCAVINDGGFWLSKGDVQIELDPDEHAQMLRYLERMAEEA